jgi:23S rRNA pseudouridine1911/1915/1917 synthase
MDNISSRILHCDEKCIVVNKIAGEAAEGAGKGMQSLPDLLAVQLQISSPLQAVHRLDVPVTGCSLFARSKQAFGFLSGAFSSGKVEKHYWAIVEQPKNGAGKIPFLESSICENTQIVHWLDFDRRRNKSVAYDEEMPGRKKAVLRCRLLGRGDNYLFMEIELVTGRHHQIRAQLEHIGLHIKGDLKYGSRRSEKNGGIRLHARSISFPDPADGARRITVCADPPVQDSLWQAFKAQAQSCCPPA